MGSIYLPHNTLRNTIELMRGQSNHEPVSIWRCTELTRPTVIKSGKPLVNMTSESFEDCGRVLFSRFALPRDHPHKKTTIPIYHLLLPLRNTDGAVQFSRRCFLGRRLDSTMFRVSFQKSKEKKVRHYSRAVDDSCTSAWLLVMVSFPLNRMLPDALLEIAPPSAALVSSRVTASLESNVVSFSKTRVP